VPDLNREKKNWPVQIKENMKKKKLTSADQNLEMKPPQSYTNLKEMQELRCLFQKVRMPEIGISYEKQGQRSEFIGLKNQHYAYRGRQDFRGNLHVRR